MYIERRGQAGQRAGQLTAAADQHVTIGGGGRSGLRQNTPSVSVTFCKAVMTDSEKNNHL